MILLGFILIAVIRYGEAFLESIKGDNHHARSLSISMILTGLDYLFLIPKTLNYTLAFVFAVILVGVWFDEMHNLFKGRKLGYLGSSKYWDPFLKRFSKSTVFMFRWGISGLCVMGITANMATHYELIGKADSFELLSAVIIFALLGIAGVFIIRKSTKR